MTDPLEDQQDEKRFEEGQVVTFIPDRGEYEDEIVKGKIVRINRQDDSVIVDNVKHVPGIMPPLNRQLMVGLDRIRRWTKATEPPEVTPNPKEATLFGLIDELPTYSGASSETRVFMMTAVIDHLRKAMPTAEARAHAAKHATGDLACFIEHTSPSEFWRRFYRGSPGEDLNEVIKEIRSRPMERVEHERGIDPDWSLPEGSPTPEEWREIVDERLAVAAVLEEARSIALSGEDGDAAANE